MLITIQNTKILITPRLKQYLWLIKDCYTFVLNETLSGLEDDEISATSLIKSKENECGTDMKTQGKKYKKHVMKTVNFGIIQTFL